MNEIKKWLKLHWEEYLCTKTTLIALIMLYFEIFHSDIIDNFWVKIFGNLSNSEIIITAIANIIVGFLIRSKK